MAYNLPLKQEIDVASPRNLKIKIYKTVMLQVLLYGYETWYLIKREGLRLRVLENKILSRVFGSKRDGNMEWGRLYNELYTKRQTLVLL